MRSLVFDTGAVISLAMSNLLPLLEELKGRYPGDFIIPEAVKIELVDKPMATKKFKFEAIQVARLIANGTFKVIPDSQTRELTMRLLDLAGTFYKAHDNFINVVHYGEMASLAATITFNADALVLDERTTRELIEVPHHLAAHLRRKLHTGVNTNDPAIRDFKRIVTGVKVIRSCELATRAFELGLLDRYLPQKQWRKNLLDGILWGIKLNGCAITSQEIEAIKHIERV